MTDSENKSANTDNKTQKEKDVAALDESAKKIKLQSSRSSNPGLITLVFFITLATLGGFYLLWENLQQNTIKQQLSTQSIDKQLLSFKQQQEDFALQNEEQLENIHTFQDNLRTNLTNLIRNNKHLRNDWLMAEAEYLVQIANQRILLEKDATTAAVALQAADARLAEVADPALLNVRKILANDLHALNNITSIDIAGLSVSLSALTNNIPNLPLRTPDPKTHKLNQKGKTQTSTEVNSIKDLPAAIWKDIKSLIVIRNHEKPLQPLLAPNQQFFLIQNLALLIEQSRLALLNGHNNIFHDRLNTTEKWINQYFDTEHNVTRNMLASIGELQKFDIDPTLPDISSTYSAIKKYRTQGQLPEAPVTKVEEKL